MLLGLLRPRTVIEIGTYMGGSALWFADMMTVHGIQEPSVISIDIDPNVAFTDERISFQHGDARHLDHKLTARVMAAMERPILVIDDSSHEFDDVLAVLTFFD